MLTTTEMLDLCAVQREYVAEIADVRQLRDDPEYSDAEVAMFAACPVRYMTGVEAPC